MTIKFKEAVAADACVLKMNGRFFDGRKVSSFGTTPVGSSQTRRSTLTVAHQVYAGIYTGRERYKRSGAGGFDEDAEEEEAERLNRFAQWLVDGDDGE